MSDDGLYRRKDSPYWWTTIRHPDGSTKKVSTRCRDRAAARAARRELERIASDPRHAAANATTLGDYLERHLEHLKKVRKRADGTLDMHRVKAGHLVRLIGGDTPLAKIDARVVDGYIGKREDEGAAQSTVHKELCTLRGALKLARRDRAYPYQLDEVFPIAFAPEYEPRRRFAQPEDAEALLADLHAHNPLRGAHFAFFLATGARLSESERAQREDIRLDAGEVDLRGSKTKKARRTVPIVTARARVLLEYVLAVTANEPGPQLFPRWLNIRRDLAAACQRVAFARLQERTDQTELELRKLVKRGAIPRQIIDGLCPRVTPNDLRRTSATWLRQGGVTPDVIGEFLGHVDGRMAAKVYGVMNLMRRQLGEEPQEGQREDKTAKKTTRRRRPTGQQEELPGASAERKQAHKPGTPPELSGSGQRTKYVPAPDVLRALGALGALADPSKSAGFLVPRDGIEPPTRGFSIPCSTN